MLRSTIIRNQVGIYAYGATRITDSTIAQSTDAGVLTGSYQVSLRILRSKISDNASTGVRWLSSAAGGIRESVLTGNGGTGLDCEQGQPRVALKDTIVSDNTGEGIHGHFSGSLRLTRCRIRGNGGHGVVQGPSRDFLNTRCRLQLTETQAVGNGMGPSCGTTEACADLVTCDIEAPVLRKGSQCDTSYVFSSGFPGETWAVCLLD